MPPRGLCLSTGLLFLCGLVAQSAGTATVFLSEKGMDPGPDLGVNPTITLDVGQTTALHLWAQVPPTEKVIGLAIDILNMTPNIARANDAIHYNPSFFAKDRWEEGDDITVGAPAELLEGMVLPAVTTWGLDGSLAQYAEFFPDFEELGLDLRMMMPTTGDPHLLFHVATMTIEGLTPGATNVFITSTDMGGVVYHPDYGGPLIHLGWGDDPVNTNLAGGIASDLPDATIIVLPEPAAAGILTLAGFASLCRRRR